MNEVVMRVLGEKIAKLEEELKYEKESNYKFRQEIDCLREKYCKPTVKSCNEVQADE